jgi:RNA polymerase sigma-70 factor (ECF subfamily)
VSSGPSPRKPGTEEPWNPGTLEPLIALIERRVDVRFALTAQAFAESVVERLRSIGTAGAVVERAGALNLDDLYLATACGLGDEAAWRECRERYFRFLREFAGRFLHASAAGDVCDQVIADLWQRRRLARYDGRSTLRTWLGAVLAHAAINAGKVERRTTSLDAASEDPGRRLDAARHLPGVPAIESRSFEDLEAERVFGDLVRRALGELEPDEKLLLLLYYEQGLTLEQMEPVLHLSKATLSRRLQAVRARLRALMETHAERTLGSGIAALRERLDFSRLDVDLTALLGPGERP